MIGAATVAVVLTLLPSESALRDEIEKRLNAESKWAAVRVTVMTGGMVRLTGRVRIAEDKWQARNAVWKMDLKGVKAVFNDIVSDESDPMPGAEERIWAWEQIQKK